MMALINCLTFLGKHARLCLPLGLCVALILPDLGKQIRHMVPPIIIIIYSSAMIRLDIRAAIKSAFIVLGTAAWQSRTLGSLPSWAGKKALTQPRLGGTPVLTWTIVRRGEGISPVSLQHFSGEAPGDSGASPREAASRLPDPLEQRTPGSGSRAQGDGMASRWLAVQATTTRQKSQLSSDRTNQVIVKYATSQCNHPS